jgi:hypothetical protein
MADPIKRCTANLGVASVVSRLILDRRDGDRSLPSLEIISWDRTPNNQRKQLVSNQEGSLEAKPIGAKMLQDLRAQNFIAVVPALGNLVGSGNIDSKNNLDFRMPATVKNALGSQPGFGVLASPPHAAS